jgi:vacuolar iron transporter family protein
MSRSTHPERHRRDRIGWLRAAVLGANDGIVSTASLIGGIAAASAGVWASAWRVTFWGALAMAITAGVGSLFGAAV